MSILRSHIRQTLKGTLNENLMPDNIIDTFYKRIKERLALGVDRNHPTIQKELSRIMTVNGGKIPEKILELFKK